MRGTHFSAHRIRYATTLALAVAALGTTVACQPTPAYGMVRGTDYPSMYDGRGGSYRGTDVFLPVWSKGNEGVIRINWFIPADPVTYAYAPVGEGDGRGFDAWSKTYASRMSIELNYENGEFRAYAHESCTAFGAYCRAPRPLRDSTEADANYNSFSIWQRYEADGDLVATVTIHAFNSFAVWPIDCGIDSAIEMHFAKDGSINESHITGDTFPALEAYQWRGTGGAVKWSRQRVDSGGLGALC